MEKVDHIGIAVRDLDERITYYTETLGLKLLKVEEVDSQQVRVAFIDAGNVKLELLEPMSEKVPFMDLLKNVEKVFTILLLV